MHPTALNPSPAKSAGAWTSVATGMTIALVFVSCLVFVRRGQSAAAAAAIAPGVAVTSGFEDESFFAIWRAVHGQPVYGEATRLPYASGYFNWLFYRIYAGPVGVAAGRAGDASIPLAGRLVTAGAALLGAASLGVLLWRVLAGRAWVAAGLAMLVYFGPLVGWWAHTLRPDVGALVLETAALAVLLRHYRTRPLAAAVGSCLLFYGAWSFKQTYVFGLGAALLFLLLRRQLRPAALLALGSVVLWTVTFLALGPAYRAAFQATAASSVYYLSLGVENLREMLVKTAPLWVLAGACLLRRQPTTATGADRLAADARLLGSLGLLVAGPLGFVASCKLGASSYYFFTLLVMLALLAAGSLAPCDRPRLIMTGFGLAAGMQLLVLLGHAGRISLQDPARELAATWAVWQGEAEPRFSHLTSLNLPWLSPASPPLVLAFNYRLDRAAGRTFEAGGIGGLITSGYFRTLLLPADTRDDYDGGSLRSYTRGETINGLTLFRHQPVPPK